MPRQAWSILVPESKEMLRQTNKNNGVAYQSNLGAN